MESLFERIFEHLMCAADREFLESMRYGLVAVDAMGSSSFLWLCPKAHMGG